MTNEEDKMKLLRMPLLYYHWYYLRYVATTRVEYYVVRTACAPQATATGHPFLHYSDSLIEDEGDRKKGRIYRCCCRGAAKPPPFLCSLSYLIA
jgi:hypothetical protein